MSELQQPTQHVVKEKRTLQYTFTDQEIHDLSQALASKTKESISVKEEKGKIVAEYGAKLKDIEVSKNKLAEQITNGFELREVDVEILYHTPGEGQKTTKRLDTGEEIVENMEQHEFNLFTQYNGGDTPEITQENPVNEADQQEEDPFFGDSDPDKVTDTQDDSPEYTPDTLPKGVHKKGNSRNRK